MLEGTVSFRGGRLYFLEWPGAGPPLLWLHGAAGNALVWKWIAESLPNRHHIALDLPGHGLSDPVADWEIEPLANDLAQMVRATWGTELLLGGHSWGGKLSALMAAAHPELASGLILVDPSPGHALRVSIEGMVQRLFGPELGSWKTRQSAWNAVAHLPQYCRPELKPVFLRGLIRTGRKWVPRVNRDCLEAIIPTCVTFDSSVRLSALQVPILLLVAEESAHWQRTTNQRIFPRAQLRRIPGHHWLLSSCPELVSHTIQVWLEKTGL